MTSLSDLIERVEAATGPDREIDHAIYEALGSPIVRCASAATHGTDLVNWAPFYTASLDAAVTLVPEHALFSVRTLWDENKTAGLAHVSRYEVAGSDEALRRYWMDEHQSVAATPALALVAASLRALQEKDIEHG